MPKKAFITGTTGQDGSYLTELLLAKGYEVHGVVRRASTFNTSRIDHLIENPEIFGKTFFTYYGDITDPLSMNELIRKIQPDEVYHLGAMSHVGVSFTIPLNVAHTDGLSCLHVLEAVKNNCPKAKIYMALTSECFGGQIEDMPVGGYTEKSPFRPRSPYGAAKLFGYWIGRVYRESYNMYVANGILFNHESPRRGDTFVTKKITNWVKKWTKNNTTPALRCGNLLASRDWGNAKDYVEAQWLILQQEKPDDYVIATGTTYTVRQFIEECFKYLGKTITWEGEGINEKGYVDGKVVVVVDSKYYRPLEVDYLLGNPEKSKKILGWQPKYTFETLVKDMMENEI